MLTLDAKRPKRIVSTGKLRRLLLPIAFALPLTVATAQIANGTYTLTPANATGQRLDVSGQSTADGANVQIWQSNGQANQQWIFTNTGGSTYRISPAHASSKCLDVSVATNPPSGTNVHIWQYWGNANQKWTVTAVSGGYTLTPTNATGLRLNNTGTANGANVNVTTNNSSTAQRWSITAVSGGGGGAPDPGTAYVPAGLSLTFSDEFTGTSINTTKWNTLAPYGAQHLNDEIECYEPAGVIVSGGLCNLRANPQATSCGSAYTWRSGAITTNGAYRYGYYEARIRCPLGKGMWPAFWLASSTRWPPEWDIVEIPNTIGTLFQYLHPVSGATTTFQGGASGSDSIYTSGEGMPNPYTGYVIYGMQWTSTTIKYWVNGRLTAQWAVSTGTGDFMWVSCNLAVGGNWPGWPDATTPNPSNMYIDYVRIYQ